MCTSRNSIEMNGFLAEESNDIHPFNEMINSEIDVLNVEQVMVETGGIMCRACLSKNTEMHSLFFVEANNTATSLLDKFVSCTSLEISENDEYPKQICKKCLEELLNAFEFRTKCHNALKELNRIAGKVDFEHVIKVEVDVSIVKSEPYHATDDESEYDAHSDLDYTPRRSSSKPRSVKRIKRSCTKKKPDSSTNKRVSQKSLKKKSIEKCDRVRSYPCTVCDRTFDRLQHLNEHKKQHKVIKTCRRCHIYFNTIEEYVEHTKTHNKFLCPDCGQFCKTLTGFNSHIASHSDEQPHGCETCGRKYKSKTSLQIHMRTHSGEKRYTCEHCNEKFVSWHSKSSHIITHHTNVKSHVCSVCNKAFKRSGRLVIHMRQHTGEKPYKCPQCPMAFYTKYDMKRHYLTHTGEKNYSCPVCDKRFARTFLVKQHMVTHTGERKHRCEVCGKAFTQAHVLRTHMRTHLESYAK